MKLEIEPIPISTWGISLANRLPKTEWGKLRKKAFVKAKYICIICHTFGEEMQCHEKWQFNDRERIQTLIGLECLCKKCHDVKHLGRSREVYSKEYIEDLLKHWCKVNKKKMRDFYIYENKIFAQNRKRAKNFYIVKVGGLILT